MSMKKKNTAKCIVFILITFLLVGLLSDGMKSNDMISTASVKGFYREEKNTLDAVVIGASETYTGYAPTLAWERYGYTSYVYGSPGASGNLYRYMLAEVLRRQKPKVVAFEINGFVHDDDYYYNAGYVRNVLDNMRWSSNRVEAIRQLVPKEQQQSFFFPIAAYHSGWSSPKAFLKNVAVKGMLTAEGTSCLKGVSTYSYQYEMEEISHAGSYHFTEQGRAYLEELLEYCQEQGIEHVLFFRSPHGNLGENPEVLQEIWDVVESYGYDTLDCSQDPKMVGIDIQTDFYNREHLNLYGMEKFTDYLGNYFVTEYGLAGEHTGKVADRWNACAEKADRIFAECREDLERGVVRHYMEPAVYIKPSVVENVKKELAL